eukprot:scaffold5234_cov131-Cylindrotheca_fusiformis.AAC.11
MSFWPGRNLGFGPQFRRLLQTAHSKPTMKKVDNRTMVQLPTRRECKSSPQHVTKKRKLVQFGAQPETRLLSPVTDEEVQARWYDANDYKRFKSSIRTVVRQMINGNDKKNMIEDNEYCTRGLEIMTPAARQHLDQVRRRTLAAVWNGQVRQWNEQDKIFDPEAIARACQKETYGSARIARSFGMADELAMREDCGWLIKSKMASLNRRSLSSEIRPQRSASAA